MNEGKKSRSETSDSALVTAVADAVRQRGVSGTDAESELQAIADGVSVDLVEVFPDELREIGENLYEGPLTLHVTLQFGAGETKRSIQESFPGRFSVVVTESEADPKAEVRQVYADVSSYL